MPVEFAAYVAQKTAWQDYLLSTSTLIYVTTLVSLYLTYLFFQGTANPVDADMHGKVILMTGGTSGIGACVAETLAARGAQLILLVRKTSDGWTQDFITELRDRTGNQLIYAEECNLESLFSVRQFATRWIDNTPPRRLDQVILCAGTTLPLYTPRRTTADGVEIQFGVNYLAHHLLLSILSPAIRAQPSERDVRVIATTCTSYLLASADLEDPEFITRGYPSSRPWQAFGASKLYLMAHLQHLQRKISTEWRRPDGMPCRVKYLLVDPGFARTQSFRRLVTFGTMSGLFFYLLSYPFWFLFFKSGSGAAQSILFASMAPPGDVHQQGVHGGQTLQECQVKQVRRKEIMDQTFQDALWNMSEALITKVEKRSALLRKELEKEEKRNH